jgi:hypothetical protein
VVTSRLRCEVLLRRALLAARASASSRHRDALESVPTTANPSQMSPAGRFSGYRPRPIPSGTSPYPHRYLTVVPLIAYQRYDGEVTVWCRRGVGAEVPWGWAVAILGGGMAGRLGLMHRGAARPPMPGSPGLYASAYPGAVYALSKCPSVWNRPGSSAVRVRDTYPTRRGQPVTPELGQTTAGNEAGKVQQLAVAVARSGCR